MTDKIKTLAEIGFNPKFDAANYAPENTVRKQRAPASAGEIDQRKALKAKHSERVFHGGKPGAGEKVPIMAGTLIQTYEAPGEGGRKSKRRLAEALYAQGIENTPIQHWMQGVGRMAQAAMGGYHMHQLDQDDKERDRQQTALLLGAPGLAPSGANAVRAEPPSSPAIAEGGSRTRQGAAGGRSQARGIGQACGRHQRPILARTQ
jgi:hypothetical protein